MQDTNSQILPAKTPPGNPITDYYQKKKEKKIQNIFALQAFTRNFSWIYLSCVIYRTSTDHVLID